MKYKSLNYRERKEIEMGLSDGISIRDISQGLQRSPSSISREILRYTIEGEYDAFSAEMTKRGVGNGVYYPIPVHQLPSFGHTFDLPETTSAAAQVLSIPVHPALSQNDLETVVSVINSIAAAGA